VPLRDTGEIWHLALFHAPKSLRTSLIKGMVKPASWFDGKGQLAGLKRCVMPEKDTVSCPTAVTLSGMRDETLYEE
jgi:hypothetical protein